MFPFCSLVYCFHSDFFFQLDSFQAQICLQMNFRCCCLLQYFPVLSVGWVLWAARACVQREWALATHQSLSESLTTRTCPNRLNCHQPRFQKKANLNFVCMVVWDAYCDDRLWTREELFECLLRTRTLQRFVVGSVIKRHENLLLKDNFLNTRKLINNFLIIEC